MGIGTRVREPQRRVLIHLRSVASDRELLDAWHRGDKASGEELFDRYFTALVRFFRNKVARGVDDLVQKTLLGCLEGSQRYRGDVPFRSFVFGVARNVLSNHFRAERHDVQPELHSAADLGPSPRSILVARAEDRLLLEGLRRIPLRDQTVLELYFWEQLPASEVASVMGAPEPTVRTWIRRAKERLAGELDELRRATGVQSTHTDLDDWADAVRRAMDATGTKT